MEINSLIDNDFILLDVPQHRNIGDYYILLGELEYLKKNSHKLIYMSDMFSFKFEEIKDNIIIILHGGGNFGDLYRKHQEFRLKIIEKYKKNKIIIMPQTVLYNNESNFINDINIINGHSRLFAFFRDQNSLLSYNRVSKNEGYLNVDCGEYFVIKKKYKSSNKNRKILILDRIDMESKPIDYSNILTGSKVEIRDWPSYGKSKLENIINILSDRVLNIVELAALSRIKNSSKVKKIFYKLYLIKSRYLVDQRLRFLSNYEIIYTTRLHGMIMGKALKKTIFILDNKYDKCKNYYYTWLINEKNISIMKE